MKPSIFPLLIAFVFGCKSVPNTSEVKEVSSQTKQEFDPHLIHKIVAYVRTNFLNNVTPEDIRARMLFQLKVLGIADSRDGSIYIPENLANHSKEQIEVLKKRILPDAISLDNVDGYLAELAFANSQNSYLIEVVNKMQLSPALMSKIQSEGGEVFPDILAYGLLLENLSRVLREDVEFLKYCREMWKYRLVSTLAPIYFKKFEIEKLPVLNKLGDDYVKYQAAWKNSRIKVPFSFGYEVLPENIIAATKWDKKWGNDDNVVAGRVLCENPPGWTDRILPNGAGPTRIADDDVGMLFNPPIPEKWADLYLVWNLDFISSYENWPYFFMKLITPYVAGHHGNSTEFLHKRGMALLIHAHFILIGRALKTKFSKVRWDSKQMYIDFGRINRAIAAKYQASIRGASGNWENNLPIPDICKNLNFTPEARKWSIDGN